VSQHPQVYIRENTARKNNTCKSDGKLGKQQQEKSDEKSSQIRIVIFQAWHWHDPYDATAPYVP